MKHLHVQLTHLVLFHKLKLLSFLISRSLKRRNEDGGGGYYVKKKDPENTKKKMKIQTQDNVLCIAYYFFKFKMQKY